jgi:hypothetical protein
MTSATRGRQPLRGGITRRAEIALVDRGRVDHHARQTETTMSEAHGHEGEIDVRERGLPKDGAPQLMDRRLFMQLLVFDVVEGLSVTDAERSLALDSETGWAGEIHIIADREGELVRPWVLLGLAYRYTGTKDEFGSDHAVLAGTTLVGGGLACRMIAQQMRG